MSDKLDFHVGYTKGGTKVWIRTESDVQDVWTFVRCGDSVSLWCHGAHFPSTSKKSHISVIVVVKVTNLCPKRKRKRKSEFQHLMKK